MIKIIPSVFRKLSVEDNIIAVLEMTKLSKLEQKEKLEKLLDEFHLTQEAVAERTGKDRATVANAIRLLKLEKQIQDWIEEGKLTAGHGRALLRLAGGVRHHHHLVLIDCMRAEGNIAPHVGIANADAGGKEDMVRADHVHGRCGHAAPGRAVARTRLGRTPNRPGCTL